MRSEAALSEVAERVEHELRAPGRRPGPVVVAVDGRSGAGKTTFARRLTRSLRERGHGVGVLHMDGVYPGWDGLEAAVRLLAEELLPRLRRGEVARWPSWRWDADAPGPPYTLRPRDVVVVEGVGSGSREARHLTDLLVWLEAPDHVRHHRAMARDGDTYRPHWDRWAAQEDRYLAREQPEDHADITVETESNRTLRRP